VAPAAAAAVAAAAAAEQSSPSHWRGPEIDFSSFSGTYRGMSGLESLKPKTAVNKANSIGLSEVFNLGDES
jgi:hypothetical protein